MNKHNRTPSRQIAKTVVLLSLAVSLTMSVEDVKADAGSPDDILVIAHKSSKVSSLNIEEVRAIFQKKRSTWSSGDKVVPINAKADSPLRWSFLRRAFGMSMSDETSYWLDTKVRKGIDEPVEFADPLKAVYHIKNSVSYVFRSDYREGVAKVLLVLPD